MTTPTPPLPSSSPTGTAGPRIWYPEGATHDPQRRAVVRHSLDTHPLLQLDALRDLAKRLAPSGQTKFLKQGTKADSTFDTLTKADDGRNIDQVFERIEEKGSWISMYNVATEPAYRALLQQAMDSTRPFVDPLDPGMFNIDGFIFVSAPPSVTPFHIDRENNFLVQIRGRKRFQVWDPADRTTVSLPAVERFIVQRDLSDVHFRAEGMGAPMNVELGAGEGIYMPSTSAHLISTEEHWARPGDGVSVTIGIVFYTDATRRAANVHALNHLFRRLGLNPSAPGRGVDALKYPMARAYVAARKALLGYTPPPGM